MKSKVLTLLIFCFAITEIKAQKISFGSCVSVPVNPEFNATLVSKFFFVFKKWVELFIMLLFFK